MRKLLLIPLVLLLCLSFASAYSDFWLQNSTDGSATQSVRYGHRFISGVNSSEMTVYKDPLDDSDTCELYSDDGLAVLDTASFVSSECVLTYDIEEFVPYYVVGKDSTDSGRNIRYDSTPSNWPKQSDGGDFNLTHRLIWESGSWTELTSTNLATIIRIEIEEVVPPTPTGGNQSLERSTEIEQIGSINIASTGYVNVVNGTFNMDNSSNIVASWTVDIDNRQTSIVSCRALVDGEELNTEVVRTFSGVNTVASLSVFSTNLSLSAGDHWSALQCKKNLGSSFFTASNGKGIIHSLYDDLGENITFLSFNTTASFTGSTDWVNFGTVSFVNSNKSSTGLNRELIFEGSINYIYDSESVMSFVAEVDGVNTTSFSRFGVAGSNGSGGGLAVAYNQTVNQTVNFTLYGKSTSGDGNASFNIIIKEFITDDGEVNSSTAESVIIGTTPLKISSLTLNNSDHFNANIVSKVVATVESTSGDQEVYLFLGNDIINESENTRSISNGEAGVVVSQNVFDSIGTGEHNITLWGYTDSGSAVINNVSLISYITDNIPFTSLSYQVRAFDSWDNSSINLFNVTNEDGTIFNTSTGVVNITPTGATDTLTITANNYFSTVYINHDVTNNLSAYINQSTISFSASQIITNTTISNVLFNVSDGTNWETGNENNTFGLKAGSYNVTASKTGFFNRTISFSVSALDVKTVNVTSMSGTIINFTATNAWGGAVLNTFTINNSLVGEFSTNNGYIEVPSVINLTLLFDLLSDGFATKYNTSITPNSSVYDYSIVFYPENSLNVTFYYEVNGSLAENINITADFVSDSFASNYSTNTGKLNITLTYPDDYIVRYSATGFPQRSYFFTMNNNTHLDLDLSLVSGADNVTILVFDTLGNPLTNAYVKVLKFSVLDNSYNIVEVAKTNFEGETVAQIFTNNELYKFIIEYNGETVLTTSGSVIYDNEITLYADLLADPFNELFAKTSLYGVITRGINNTFTYVYTDGDGLANQGCLYAYKTTFNTETLYNSSCSSGAAGSVTIGVDNTTGSSYFLKGYITKGGSSYYVTNYMYSYGEGFEEDGNGVLLVAILVIAFALIGFWKLEAAVLFAGLSTLLVSVMGIINIDVTYTAGIFLLSIVTAFIISKRSGTA